MKSLLRSLRRARVLALCMAILPVSVMAQNGYAWKNVKISGAGALVTGVVVNPAEQGVVYIRTDVGGAYRWDPANSRWIALNDDLEFEQRFHFGCESLAVDPNDADVVYYAGGTKIDREAGYILKSTDRGETWTKLTPGLTTPMGGGNDRRWAGERLAVDPFNSSILIFGSRTDGLWRSTDGGLHWTKSTDIPTPSGIYGVQCVAFAPNHAGRVYVGVSGYGVYASTDHGATFSFIGGATEPMRMEVGSNAALWYTSRTRVQRYWGTTWTDFTPGLSSGTDIYSAVTINPGNPQDILVGRKEQLANNFQIYRTTNNGSTWTALTHDISMTPVPWYWKSPTKFRTSALAFDPFNTNVVWGDYWRTDNINASPVSWVMQPDGHEEDVVNTLIAPPAGPGEVLTGSMDNDGFLLDNGLDTFPSKTLGITGGSWNGHTWGFAYQETNPLNMMRIGAQAWYGGVINVAKSTNGGVYWNRINNFPANLYPIHCAMSATDANRMVVVCNPTYSGDSTGATWTNPQTVSQPWRYTYDGGATWHPVSGLPIPPAYNGPFGRRMSLAADHVDGNNFYYYYPNYDANPRRGELYRSTDGGASFHLMNSSLPCETWHLLKTLPGTQGDLWLCLDKDNVAWQSFNRDPGVEGLWHSTDSGATWTKMPNVNRAFSFGFGKPAEGSSVNPLFVYGRVSGVTTDDLYRTINYGTTWDKITTPDNRLGDTPAVIEGSRQTYGRVFVGTGGRGVFYGSTVTLPGTVQMEDYDQGGEGVAYHDKEAANLGGYYRNDGVDIAPSPTGYRINYGGTNEWLNYTVDVETAGTYIVSFLVATPNDARLCHLEDASGQSLTGLVNVPNTGSYGTWAEAKAIVTLPAGIQTLKFYFDTGSFDIDSMSFERVSLPGTVQMENYDQGGEGVGYHDKEATNLGGYYRTDGVDIALAPTGYRINYGGTNEWLNYSVNVQTAGTYVVTLRVTTPNGGRYCHLENEQGVSLTGQINIPNTGGYDNWTDVQAVLTLPAGSQTLKFYFDTGSFDIDSMDFDLY